MFPIHVLLWLLVLYWPLWGLTRKSYWVGKISKRFLEEDDDDDDDDDDDNGSSDGDDARRRAGATTRDYVFDPIETLYVDQYHPVLNLCGC